MTLPRGIGLGLAALGRPGYLNLGHGDDLGPARTPEDLRARTAEVLDAAYAGGVRYLDAARSYGRAEEFLPLARRPRAPATSRRLEVGLHLHRRLAGRRRAAEVKDHSDRDVRAPDRRDPSAARRRLDLYQIHSATLGERRARRPRVLERSAALRAGGVAHRASVDRQRDRPTTIDRARWRSAASTRSRHVEPARALRRAALAEAHDAGLQVIVKEALANGRLHRPRRARRAARRRGGRAHGDAGRVALAAALAQPWSTVVLSGASTVPMLESNLAARDAEPDPRLDALREESGRVLGPAFLDVLDVRAYATSAGQVTSTCSGPRCDVLGE